MKTKNNDKEREILLTLLDMVNSEEEYRTVQRQLAELDNPALALCGKGISSWLGASKGGAL